VLHVGVNLIESARGEHVRKANGFDAQPADDGLLGQMAERALVLHRTRDAQVLGRVTEQHAQERCLAGAVAPNESDLLTVAHRERHGAQNTTCANLYSQIPDY
jgi:hypothetical protein